MGKTKYIRLDEKHRCSIKYEPFYNWFTITLEIKHWFWGFIDTNYRVHVSEGEESDRLEQSHALIYGGEHITYRKGHLDFNVCCLKLMERRLTYIREREQQIKLFDNIK